MNNTFPESWTLLPIEKCMSEIIDYRGKSPNKTTSGIPLVTAKVVKGGRIEKLDEFISEDDYDEWMCRGLPKPGDVVLTTEAPLGEVAQLDDRKVALAQRLITLRGKSEILDNTFLKFLFQDEFVQEQLHSRATGTTVLGIRQSELRKIILPIPPLPEQRAIAHILGTLDDKIELNRRMNETLEAMARAIFKSWFVDFDPVRAKAEGRDTGLPEEIADLFPDSFEETELGEVPKGWKIGTLGDIATVIDCLHSKKPERTESGKPLLQLGNIRDDGLIDMEDTYFISENDYEKWISRIEASFGDCVITNVGRVGAVAQIPEDVKAALGRNMTAIRCNSQYQYPTYLIELLVSDYMKGEISLKTDNGTVMSALNVKNIPKLSLVLPPKKILQAFESTASTFRRKMEANHQQSLLLKTLRNSLLPKLMSGEIRVITDSTKY